MKICVCIPSRGRSKFVERLVKSAYKNCNNKNNVIVKYYLNEDDDQIDYYKDQLKIMQKKHGDGVQYQIGPDQNTVYSWNRLAESVEADFYMLAGDEVQFVTKDWDTKIFAVKEQWPDGIFCVGVYDGRDWRKNNCTTPVVTKEWGQALGYYFNPVFWHWQIDKYTGELAMSIDRFIFLETVCVKMKKIKDITGMRNRKQGVFDRDEYMYDKMMQLYFNTDQNRLIEACDAVKE
tara:strand:+ start:54 stop:755 length:702 start_codon:yes stop_codon:yes gene_type:complete